MWGIEFFTDNDTGPASEIQQTGTFHREIKTSFFLFGVMNFFRAWRKPTLRRSFFKFAYWIC